MIVPIELLNTKTISYDITIDSLPKLNFDTKVVIVTNPTVSGYHLDKLLSMVDAKELSVVTIPDGEEYKTLETVESILNQLFERKLDRKSLLIAFGGGVIGDMTGFTASLYQRGIDFIQVPTTLLSQVDASVGGKTGVNNKYGKNLIGAFYQPKAVYIDPQFLTTLPPREFSAGVAEIVKMAVMFDSDYFEMLESADFGDEDILKEIIKKSVEIKASVVNQDEREAGIRAGDKITNINGQTIVYWEEMANGIQKSQVPLQITVLRNNEYLDFTVTPKLLETKNRFGEVVERSIIGISPDFNATATIQYELGQGIDYAYEQTKAASMIIVKGLQKLVSGLIPMENLSGVIGIVDTTSKVSSMGFVALLAFTALISVNLGVINLLPIPALDGGHIMFNFYEIITNKSPNEEVMFKLTLMGWGILLSLMLLGLYNDINRLIG